MDDIKNIVAKNITELRLLNNMTQMELAEKINYSDKTVSKWERGESSPDIAVLVEIADLFGVTLYYLVRSENIENAVVENKTKEVIKDLSAMGLKNGKVSIAHCQNEEGALKLKNLIAEKFKNAQAEIHKLRGLCSFYAEKGGFLVGFEKM